MSGSGSPVDELERLADQLERGLLTRAEFQALKTTLIERARSSPTLAESGRSGTWELPFDLGPYHLEALLGAGGFGVVYRGHARDPARSAKLGPVAVKVLDSSRAAQPEFLQRFRREADLGRRLEHPGLVPVLDLFEAGGRHALVMPFVEGRSLDVAQAHGAFEDSGTALATFLAILEAVEHAHAAGVVHRDLKPENILVRPDGRPVVLDFGIARDLGDGGNLTQTRARMGTLLYAAPEQWLDAGGADQRADIYALGLILCELVTGHFPFDTDVADRVLERHKEEGRHRDPRFLSSDLSGRVADAIDAALLVDVNERCRSCTELRSILGGEMTASVARAKARRSSPPARDRRTVAEPAGPARETWRLPAAREKARGLEADLTALWRRWNRSLAKWANDGDSPEDVRGRLKGNLAKVAGFESQRSVRCLVLTPANLPIGITTTHLWDLGIPDATWARALPARLEVRWAPCFDIRSRANQWVWTKPTDLVREGLQRAMEGCPLTPSGLLNHRGMRDVIEFIEDKVGEASLELVAPLPIEGSWAEHPLNDVVGEGPVRAADVLLVPLLAQQSKQAGAWKSVLGRVLYRTWFVVLDSDDADGAVREALETALEHRPLQVAGVGSEAGREALMARLGRLMGMGSMPRQAETLVHSAQAARVACARALAPLEGALASHREVLGRDQAALRPFMREGVLGAGWIALAQGSAEVAKDLNERMRRLQNEIISAFRHDLAPVEQKEEVEGEAGRLAQMMFEERFARRAEKLLVIGLSKALDQAFEAMAARLRENLHLPSDLDLPVPGSLVVRDMAVGLVRHHVAGVDIEGTIREEREAGEFGAVMGTGLVVGAGLLLLGPMGLALGGVWPLLSTWLASVEDLKNKAEVQFRDQIQEAQTQVVRTYEECLQGKDPAVGELLSGVERDLWKRGTSGLAEHRRRHEAALELAERQHATLAAWSAKSDRVAKQAWALAGQIRDHARGAAPHEGPAARTGQISRAGLERGIVRGAWAVPATLRASCAEGEPTEALDHAEHLSTILRGISMSDEACRTWCVNNAVALEAFGLGPADLQVLFPRLAVQEGDPPGRLVADAEAGALTPGWRYVEFALAFGELRQAWRRWEAVLPPDTRTLAVARMEVVDTFAATAGGILRRRRRARVLAGALGALGVLAAAIGLFWSSG